MYNKEWNSTANDSEVTYRSLNNQRANERLSYDEPKDWASDQNDVNGKQRRIPWRAICLALFLLIVGSVIIMVSILILFGYIVSIRPNDGLLVLMCLGFLMFIPGYYHIRIAYYAYYDYEGYAFDDIPDFD